MTYTNEVYRRNTPPIITRVKHLAISPSERLACKTELNMQRGLGRQELFPVIQAK